MEDGDYMLSTDPRLAGIRRLMIKIPETLSCYPTTYQSEESHVRWSANLKIAFEFGSFEHELPALLAGPYNKHCIFLHHSPVSLNWLCCMVNGPKFSSVSKSYFPLGTYERYIESSGKSEKECLLDSERPKEEYIEVLTLQLALEDDWDFNN